MGNEGKPEPDLNTFTQWIQVSDPEWNADD